MVMKALCVYVGEDLGEELLYDMDHSHGAPPVSPQPTATTAAEATPSKKKKPKKPKKAPAVVSWVAEG